MEMLWNILFKIRIKNFLLAVFTGDTIAVAIVLGYL